MIISELKVGQGKVDIEVVIKSKEAARSFEKYGKPLKVANAMVSDDSGEIKMSLWNDEADKFNQGDKIRITNGYVSEFNGVKQLSAGKFGKIELASEASAEKPIKHPKSAEEAMDDLTDGKKGKGKKAKMEDEFGDVEF